MEYKSYKEFEKSVKKGGIGGAIILCGEEKNLIDKGIELLYSSITDFPDLNIIKIDGENPGLDIIINACETLPVLSDRKLIHVKKADFLLKGGNASSDFVKNLTGYIKSVSNDIILLMSFEGQPDQGSSIYKTVKALGTIAEFKKLRGDELLQSVQEMFEERGKRIGKSELIYFIQEAGGTIDNLEREIDKIVSYALDEDVVTRNIIDSVIHRSIESNIFKMVDSISKRDAESAISILNMLLFQREDHLKILGMVIRQIRLLFIIKAGINEGKSPIKINEELKLNEYVFNNLVRQCKNFSEEALKNLLGVCLETDIKLKNGTFSGDFYGLALEMLLVELCK